MGCKHFIETRRRWRDYWPLISALYVIFLVASHVQAAELPRRPNIVILFADDMNYAGPSCCGGRWGLIGKWHLGGDETCGADYHPLQRGFDEFFGFYGSMVWFYRSNHIFRGTEQVKDPGYLTDVLARESCDFIRRHRDRPFLLYTAFNAVHTPLEATEEDLASVSRLDFSAFANQEKAQTRAAMLLALDRAVGRIMEALKTEGLDESTLVIFTNDNGDYNGNGPFSGGKGQVSEGGIRVPFLVRWKGRLPAGTDYREMISTLDILPTAVVAGGGKIDADGKLDGVDLTEYLAGNKQGRPHERLYWRIGQERAIREGPWKIRFNGGSGYGYRPKPGEAHWALYHLENDPGERHDLKEQEPARFSKLKDEYDRWDQQLHEPRWSFGASGQMERW